LAGSALGLHAQNCLLYGLGAAVNGGLYLASRVDSSGAPGGSPGGSSSGLPEAGVSFLAGYADNPAAMGLLLSNAVVGLLVTVVYKLGNAVVKTLALSVSSALLLLLPLLLAAVQGCTGGGVASTTEGLHVEGAVLAGGNNSPPCAASVRAETAQTVAGCAVVLVAALMFMENAPAPHLQTTKG